MTTLASLLTKDSIVMGCDSLATQTKHLVDPFDLFKEYFDPKNEFKLKKDSAGNPFLENFDMIFSKAQIVPFNHMTHVTKLFSLEPLPMGIMITGITSIADRTIKSLISEFKTTESQFNTKKIPKNYTVKSIAQKLRKFIGEFYNNKYSKSTFKPNLELMIGGYDKRNSLPSLYRILFDSDKIEDTFKHNFGIAFGGQMHEIQRIVFGTDTPNRVRLIHRVNVLFDKYRDFLQEFLNKKGITEKLPTYEKYSDELRLFKEWGLQEFDADWGDFSEQNAIECVSFFVEIMIKSQQFSARMPTVGGDVHIALISKNDGFRYISKEEYLHEGHSTPKGK